MLRHSNPIFWVPVQFCTHTHTHARRHLTWWRTPKKVRCVLILWTPFRTHARFQQNHTWREKQAHRKEWMITCVDWIVMRFQKLGWDFHALWNSTDFLQYFWNQFRFNRCPFSALAEVVIFGFAVQLFQNVVFSSWRMFCKKNWCGGAHIGFGCDSKVCFLSFLGPWRHHWIGSTRTPSTKLQQNLSPRKSISHT